MQYWPLFIWYETHVRKNIFQSQTIVFFKLFWLNVLEKILHLRFQMAKAGFNTPKVVVYYVECPTQTSNFLSKIFKKFYGFFILYIDIYEDVQGVSSGALVSKS